MSVLFDIDLDFFFNSERPLTEEPCKHLWMDPAGFMKRCAHLPCYLHLEHSEALAAWNAAAMHGWECWHFDAHADFGESGLNSPALLPPGRRADHIHSGNFLFAALREGVCARVYWILPPWLKKDEAEQRLAHIPADARAKISCLPWQEAKEQLPEAHRVDISFSPAFTPFAAIRSLAECLARDEEAPDAFVDALIAEKARLWNMPFPRFFPDSGGARCVSLYHGSAMPGLTRLEGTPLFLSPSPAVAACFGLPLDNGQGWIHGVDHLSGSMPVVYVALPADRTACLDAPMTLYRTDDASSCLPAGELRGYEYVTDAPCAVAEEKAFSSVRTALDTYGVYVGIRGRESLVPCLRDMVRAMPREVEDWLEMPVDAILALPPLEPALAVFFSGRESAPRNGLHALPFRIWRKVLDRVLLPLCVPFMLRPDSGHGLEHARQTALWTGMLAWSEGLPPLPPMLAACLHDAARADDGPGEWHACDSARLAEIVLRSGPGASLPLSDAMKEDIVAAIKGHARAAKATRPVAACLQDADRLRLAWSEGVRADLFSTKGGLALAEAGPQSGENVLAFLEALGDEEQFPLECKLEITDACNLACGFCHQGFGARKCSRVMPPADYAAWLDRLAEERIGMVRLTGGEPLLVPDIERYLQLAAERGFYVTLNSNAVLLDMDRVSRIAPFVDCLKISFPAPDEAGMLACLGKSDVWKRKLEAAAFAAARGVSVEFLTPMFPAAIRAVESFAGLLEQMSFIRWLPLRAEAAPGNKRPVTREDMLQLLDKLNHLRAHKHWEDLQLGLSVPFCLLDSPWDAARLLHGRQGCGPFSNLAINPQGKVMRCYSRRQALDTREGLRAAALRAAWEDFRQLPALCRACPAGARCQGGCRAPQSLSADGFDYLARPDQARRWLQKPLEFVLS